MVRRRVVRQHIIAGSVIRFIDALIASYHFFHFASYLGQNVPRRDYCAVLLSFAPRRSASNDDKVRAELSLRATRRAEYFPRLLVSAGRTAIFVSNY